MDAERLRELAPEVILTQTLCEVCAVTPQDLARAVGSWTGVPPTIVSLAPNRLEDVWSDVLRVGRALGYEERAQRFVAELRRRVEQLTGRAEKLTPRPQPVLQSPGPAPGRVPRDPV